MGLHLNSAAPFLLFKIECLMGTARRCSRSYTESYMAPHPEMEHGYVMNGLCDGGTDPSCRTQVPVAVLWRCSRGVS